MISDLLEFLTLAGGILFLFVLVVFVLEKFEIVSFSLTKYIKEHALLLAFLVSTTATAGSLYFSEVLGYEPCKLCWIQRIFMYPQALILWLALILKEKVILKYVFLLSLFGAPIAFYHYLLQIGVVGIVPCSVTGYSVSCSDNFGVSYGYITIPMMALTAFGLILLFSGISIFSKDNRESKEQR